MERMEFPNLFPWRHVGFFARQHSFQIQEMILYEKGRVKSKEQKEGDGKLPRRLAGSANPKLKICRN